MEKTALKTKSVHYYTKIKSWISNNKVEFIILLGIVLLGAFLRLYRIGEYMTFLGDEGRDVIVVRRLLVDFDPILVGPGTSVGNMYLGPIYYYMMAPALLLANFSPVGPAIMVALLGILTIYFTWYVAREWFGKEAAAVSSLLYAISPTIIYHSKFSWNPNIMPFFALLLVYSIWKFWKKQKWGWLIVSGLAYGVILQSHYMGMVMGILLLVFWFLGIRKSWDKPKIKRLAFRNTVFSIIIFTVLLSPLVLFDARHNWRNFSAMQEFFTSRRDTVDVSPFNSITATYPVANLVVTRLVVGHNESAGVWATLLFIVFFLWFAFVGRKKKKRDEYLLLVAWAFVGVLGLSIYRQEIYDHYYGFLFPLPFLILGAMSQEIIDRFGKVGKVITATGLLILVFLNLSNNPLKSQPNRQMQRTQEIAKKIAEEAGGDKFNIAVIAERNYEGAYWYFLEDWGAPIVGIDPQRADETITDQLFVVCEYEDRNKCQPTSNPKTEVANFGWSKIDNQWEIGGVILYRLEHNFQ